MIRGPPSTMIVTWYVFPALRNLGSQSHAGFDFAVAQLKLDRLLGVWSLPAPPLPVAFRQNPEAPVRRGLREDARENRGRSRPPTRIGNWQGNRFRPQSSPFSESTIPPGHGPVLPLVPHPFQRRLVDCGEPGRSSSAFPSSNTCRPAR